MTPNGPTARERVYAKQIQRLQAIADEARELVLHLDQSRQALTRELRASQKRLRALLDSWMH